MHPQFWPRDLDVAGKRVAVIGSGATAVTLVPALAQAGAARVTMLQRSPSYVLAMPDEDPIASALRRRLGERRAYAIVRWKNVVMATLIYQLSQRAPRAMRRLFRAGARWQLPAGYAVDTHFNPRYDPVGPAAVPGSQRRPVQGRLGRQRGDRDRRDRPLRRARASACEAARRSRPT